MLFPNYLRISRSILIYIYVYTYVYTVENILLLKGCSGLEGGEHTQWHKIHPLLCRPTKLQQGDLPTNIHFLLRLGATFSLRVSHCYFPSPPSHPKQPLQPHRPKFRVPHCFLHLCTSTGNQGLRIMQMCTGAVSPCLFLCFYGFQIKRLFPFWFAFKWKSAL